MSRIVKYAFYAALLTGGATVAAASDLPPQILNDVMQACRPDYHNVCSYVLPGDGRVGRCLLDHERDLSPSCLKAVKFAYAIEVCMPDYRRYCDGVAPGSARIVQCLADRARTLAPECERVVIANAPYIGEDTPRYGEYREHRSYRDQRYAEGDHRIYRDHAEDEDRYSHDRYSHDGHDRYDYSDREDRYTNGGYRPDAGHQERDEDSEPIK